MTVYCPVSTVLRLLSKRFRVDLNSPCSSSSEYSRRWLLQNYAAKLASQDPSELEAVTVQNWYAAEKQCFITNQRLNNIVRCDYFDAVREVIETVIGIGPSSRLCDKGSWSNGATAGTRRGVHYSRKLKGPILVTPLAARLVPYYFSGMTRWGLGEFEVSRANRCVQVPKNARTNRMIAAEPAANAFMQQSVGRFIRRRLLDRAGIDIRNQGNNQDAAFRALVDNLSTIDLQMASDTMSKSLLEHVLPHDWYIFLSSLRCEFSNVNGKTVYLEKFSSMGNAFTFELETLVFWALMKVLVGDSELWVYGDDIIIESRFYDIAVKALAYAGFTVNVEKSFKEGPFYESCGKHYYELEDVTPVYQKDRLPPNPTSLRDVALYMRAHNRLVRWGIRNGMSLVRDACLFLRGRVPPKYCLLIPLCDRDDGFITSDHGHLPDPNGDYRCRVLSERESLKHEVEENLCLAEKLRSPDRQNEHPRGYPASAGTTGCAVKRTTIWATSLY
jgi:hypothetical protein